MYIDGMQSGARTLRDSILGIPPSQSLRRLKILYGTNIRLNDLSLQYWNDIVGYLREERFLSLQSMLITVYWSHRRAKLHATEFGERVPSSFPTYNKDLTVRIICHRQMLIFIVDQIAVSITRDHPFRRLGSWTRAYHLGECVDWIMFSMDAKVVLQFTMQSNNNFKDSARNTIVCNNIAR